MDDIFVCMTKFLKELPYKYFFCSIPEAPRASYLISLSLLTHDKGRHWTVMRIKWANIHKVFHTVPV